MRDERKTKAQLIAELTQLRARLAQQGDPAQASAVTLLQEELRRRDALRAAVLHGAERLLRATHWEDVAEDWLKRIGEAAEVSRAYISENHLDATGRPVTSRRFEWSAPGIRALRSDPASQNCPRDAGPWQVLCARLERGELVAGRAAEFPPALRAVLCEQGVRSLASAPIMLEARCWGFISFDECVSNHALSALELAVLQLAANLLAAAMQRSAVDYARSESEERYRLLADGMEDFVNLNDVSGRRLYVSPSFYRVTGYTEAEVCASDFRLRVHPDDLALVEQARQANLRGEGTRIEYRCRCKDGSYLWLDLRATPLPGPDGRVARILCCSRDISAKKRAEQALQRTLAELEQRVSERTAALAASEARWRAIVDTAPDYVVLLDLAGTVRYINRPVLDLAIEQVMGTSAYAYLAPDEQRRLRDVLANVERTGTVGALELQVSARSGAAHCYALRCGPFFENGRVTGFVVVGREVTQDKLAAEALARSERDFRNLFEQARDAIVIFRPDDEVVLEVNSRACEIYGFRRDEFIGMSLIDISVDPARGRQHVRDTLDHGTKYGFETVQRRRDGSEMHIEVNAAVVEYRGAPAILSINRDVTERKRAEQILRLTQFSVDRASDAILWLDQAGRIRYVNDTACSMFGYSRSELLSQSAFDLMRESTQETWPVRWARLAACQTLVEEDLARHKSGLVFPIEVASNYVEFEGQPLNCAFLRDIRERKQKDERIRQHELQLAHFGRVATMAELASGLAHELNQPLATIAVLADSCLLRRSAAHNPASPQDLDAILRDLAREAQRAGEIMRRWRAFLKKGDFRPEPTNINQVIREVLHLLDADLRAAQVRLRLSLEDRLPDAVADAIHVQQVVVNLVRNSAEALRAAPHEARTITVSTRARDTQQIEVSVHDTGPGVPPEAQDALFKPFFTTKPQGLGMGLAISRSIVTAHGGRIWLEPGRRGGATFKFTLPTTMRDSRDAS